MAEKKILVIEALKEIAEAFRTHLTEAFPDIPIVFMTKEQYEGDVESSIKAIAAPVIILGWGMGKWSNQKYRSSGLALLPWIRKATPQTMVVFTATASTWLQAAIGKGAHVACEKGDLTKHFNDIRLHLDLL